MINWNDATPASDNLNPLDAQLAADPAASAVWNRVRRGITVMASAFDQLSALSDQLFAAVTQIEADTRLTPDAQAEDKASARNKAAEAVENLRRQCEQARQNVQSAIDAAIFPPGYKPVNTFMGNDAAASLLAFEQVKAGWERARMILDSVQDDAQTGVRAWALVKDAATRGDQDMLAGLRDNLEFYLEARGQGAGHAGFIAQFNQAQGASASPAVRAAGQIQQVLDHGWGNLQFAFNQTLNYTKGSSVERMHGLPGWPGQPPISL